MKKINAIYFLFVLCLAACNDETVQLKEIARPIAVYDALDTMPGSEVEPTKKSSSK